MKHFPRTQKSEKGNSGIFFCFKHLAGSSDKRAAVREM